MAEKPPVRPPARGLRLHKRTTVWARVLVGHRRSSKRDAALATVLAAIAGAANAGGFFAVGQYTSHMTGYLSQLADNIAIVNLRITVISVLAIGAFITGAAVSTVLVAWARGLFPDRQYAVVLGVQGGLLLCFSGGGIFSTEAGRVFSMLCLCFIMGMQNATITKISQARIRTTHATGMITDIGIEVGRAAATLIWRNPVIRPDWPKLRILLTLVGAFLGGGVIGALGYGQVGFFFSAPLALILLTMSLPTLILGRRRKKTMRAVEPKARP